MRRRILQRNTANLSALRCADVYGIPLFYGVSLQQEMRELELSHKNTLRQLEKDKRSLEKDLKKALRAVVKAEKGSSREETRLKDLLAIVVAQVRERIKSRGGEAQRPAGHRRCSGERKSVTHHLPLLL